MTQPSKLPWTPNKYGELRDANGDSVIVWGLGLMYGQRSPNTEANSAFIIEAVNSHAALVARVEKLEAALIAIASCKGLAPLPDGILEIADNALKLP